MTPADAESARFLYLLISAIGNLTAVVASVVAVMRSFKRQPPISEEMYKDFATKRELEKLREDSNRSLASGEKLFQDLQRTLGRIEGILERCPYICFKKPGGD